MKRNGFTMVELIFVIVIIGILSVAAIPKFGDIKDKAKINSELSSLEGLDAAVVSAREGRYDDYGDSKVNWHNYADMNSSSNSATARATEYKKINLSKKVLSKIAKKSEQFKIVGWGPVDSNGNWSWNDGLYDDILMIESTASSSKVGIKYPKDAPGQDISGKPDKNDFWIFNPSNVDIKVVGNDANTPINPTIVESGSLKLIDVNGTKTISNASSVRFTGLTNSNGSATQFYFRNPAQ